MPVVKRKVYALELHSSKNNIHTIQSSELEESQAVFTGQPQTDTGQEQACVNVSGNASEIVVEGRQERHNCSVAAATTTSKYSQSLHVNPEQKGTTRERVVMALTAYGVAQFRARQLAPTVIAANLDEKYIHELADWISSQAALRRVYNPAGFLVQMVYQLAPVPVPAPTGSFSHPQYAGSGSSSGSNPSNNVLDLNQNQEVITKHLPRLIEIEQRNLQEGSCERDRTAAWSKLDKLLALQDPSRLNTNTLVSTTTAPSAGTADSYPRYVQVEQESPKEDYA